MDEEYENCKKAMEEDISIQPLNLEIMKPVAHYQHTEMEEEVGEEPKTILDLEISRLEPAPISYVIETIAPSLPDQSLVPLDYPYQHDFYRFSGPIYVANPPNLPYPYAGNPKVTSSHFNKFILIILF